MYQFHHQIAKEVRYREVRSDTVFPFHKGNRPQLLKGWITLSISKTSIHWMTQLEVVVVYLEDKTTGVRFYIPKSNH